MRNQDELLTSSAVARINGVGSETVRVWVRTGKITPAFRTPNGVNLFTREEGERIARVRAARRRVASGQVAPAPDGE